MKNNKIVVGITHGDINSISYEVIIKSLMNNRLYDYCIPVVYGSPKVAAYHRKALNIDNFSFNNIKDADEANPKRANIINCVDENVRVDLGQSTNEAGMAAFEALEKATDDLANHKIDVLVTGPINKKNIQSDKFNFSGHTEYLQYKSKADASLMLMVHNKLRVGLATNHLPIQDVSKYLNTEEIVEKIQVMNKSLIKDFGIRKPRIAVLGLNPHAGDNGLLGKEEEEIIDPAIKQAYNEGILVFGPFAADGFFGSGTYTKFDAILAMYHDQGLTPFKTITYEEGINFTAGLDIVRTSPAHGTGFEIAGKNTASATSFRNAIYYACDIFRTRKGYENLTSNPLKPHNHSDLQ